MIVLLWVINFAISWFNAWGCGKNWNESKAAGGFPHLVNWSAAAMSASGFTWCYLVVLGGLASVIETTGDDGLKHALLSPDSAQAFADLGFLLIIGPILGSGIVLTLHAWSEFWRRRTLANGAIAAWDTFAQIYNMRQAFVHVPGAFGRLGDFFKGSKSDSDSAKGKAILLVVGLVALAAVGGILTTRTILLSTARKVGWERRMRYEPYAP